MFTGHLSPLVGHTESCVKVRHLFPLFPVNSNYTHFSVLDGHRTDHRLHPLVSLSFCYDPSVAFGWSLFSFHVQPQETTKLQTLRPCQVALLPGWHLPLPCTSVSAPWCLDGWWERRGQQEQGWAQKGEHNLRWSKKYR